MTLLPYANPFIPACFPIHVLSLFGLDTGMLLRSFPPTPASRPLLFLIQPVTPTPLTCRLTFFHSVCCTTVVYYSFTPHPYARTHAPAGIFQDFISSLFIHSTSPFPGLQPHSPSPCQFYTPGSPQYSPSFIACTSTPARAAAAHPPTHPPAVLVRRGPKSCILCYCSSELVMWAVISYTIALRIFCPVFVFYLNI